jgi:hypothetical protein
MYADAKKVHGKTAKLYSIAEASLAAPDELVRPTGGCCPACWPRSSSSATTPPTGPVMDALDLLGHYADVPGKVRHYDDVDKVPITGVVPGRVAGGGGGWRRRGRARLL